ncbi:MAG: DUF7594 domain-containing protein [Solirubrobacteraceae bacterium]
MPASADSQSFGALADAYVSSATPTSNYGGSTKLRVDGSPTIRSYLRFDVRVPAGATITDARLRLYTTSTGTSTGFSASAVADDSWAEASLTHANAPAVGALLGQSGGWSSTGYKEVPLAAGAVEAGLNSFALATTSSYSKSFYSREAASKPELIVTYSSAGAPSPSPEPSVGAPAVPSAGAYFGTYVSERSTGRTLLETEAMVGRKFAVAHDYRRWDHSPFISDRHRTWADGGRLVYLNWHAKKRDGSMTSWADIASGGHDARIDAVAQEAKLFGRPMFIAFHHEPENEVGGYGSASDFADAFRRIVRRFEQHGVSNVAWVWNIMGTSKYYGQYSGGLYPGDDVVDWIAWDPYNWVDCHGRSGTWVEFADKVQTFYDWLGANGHADKPFMLGEYGSDEPLAGQPSKGSWFRGARDAMSGAGNGGVPRFPNLKALVYFDSDHTSSSYSSGCAWHIDSSASSLSGFQAMGADPYFQQAGG